MTSEMRKMRDENCSQSAKTCRGTVSPEQQDEERRFLGALEDDEVREALKFMHERDERMRKEREESGSKSAKIDCGALLLEQEEERRFQDALEEDEVREALKLMHARDNSA